jgi:diaminohydroxyphosphoribosylaminopyrimidine deaminase / 5-amino-6-(5-phosphoribosylamino)uracil reductase
MVGALLVKDGRVVGEGFHRYDLLKHSEIYAIEMAGNETRGATLYCNLEPCCHHGRTPPCTDALIQAGISRAVIATRDPNPKVNGRGVEQLREAGIEVDVGVLEERARILNESYFKFISTGRPFVHGVVEYPADSAALLLDWQPSAEFLGFASKYDAVMIGSRPELNRVVVEHALNRERHRRLVIASADSDRSLLDALQKRIDSEVLMVTFDPDQSSVTPANVLRLQEGTSYVDVARPATSALLLRLGRMDVTSLLWLPGPFDSVDTETFDQFDKLSLAVPSNTIKQGFTRKWVFGDIEFDLEHVSIEQAGSYTELTGYPSVQEVA